MGKVLHALKEVASFISVAIVLIILITNAIVMVYSLAYLPQFIGDEYFAIPLYILVPVPLLFAVLWGPYAYAWYVFLVFAITASLTLFLYGGMRDYVTKLMREPLSYRNASVQEFAEIFSLTLFVSVSVVILMKLLGVSTEGIGLVKMPLYSQMLSLLHASVYEEIVTRVVFLGIPVYLTHKLLAFHRNEESSIRAINIFGGVKKIGRVEVAFIIISALIFGVAHTPAWGWWKMLPAFIAGLGMGYLFIRYGIHYSILFHFATDYMYVAMSMSHFTALAMGVIYVVLIVLGLVFLVSYSARILQYFHLVKKPQKREKIEVPEPWIDVRCPNCGSQKFIYHDGKLKCVDCGTIFEYEYPGQSGQSESGYQESKFSR